LGEGEVGARLVFEGRLRTQKRENNKRMEDLGGGTEDEFIGGREKETKNPVRFWLNYQEEGDFGGDSTEVAPNV